MFSKLKGYLYLAGGILGIILVGWWKYITGQNKKLKSENQRYQATIKAQEKQRTVERKVEQAVKESREASENEKQKVVTERPEPGTSFGSDLLRKRP